jgi:hypothetical protein
MNMREIRFDELSAIKYRMFLDELPKAQGALAGDRVLIIEFAGSHGIGSEGNNDSLFMEAIINTAIQIWFVDGMVLDYRNLYYEWGNAIGSAIRAGKKVWGNKFPTAVVVSELCRNGLETARPFYASQPLSEDQSKWLFDDMDSALSYIKEQLDSLKSDREKKPGRKLFKRR